MNEDTRRILLRLPTPVLNIGHWRDPLLLPLPPHPPHPLIPPIPPLHTHTLYISSVICVLCSFKLWFTVTS